MINTNSKSILEKAEKLNQLLEEKKRLEKEEAELKEWFKRNGKDLNICKKYTLILKEVSRENLDKNKLKDYLKEKFNNFVGQSTYITVNLKKL